MADDTGDVAAASGAKGGDLLAEMQHWTWVAGRAQQMLLEFASEMMLDPARAEEGRLAMERLMALASAPPSVPSPDPAAGNAPTADWWTSGISLWQATMNAGLDALAAPWRLAEPAALAPSDHRFAHSAWETHPLFAQLRLAYQVMSERMLAIVDGIDGLPPAEKGRMRFTTSALVDALAPTNFAFTNPAVIERAIATQGRSLLTGLERMLDDLRRGQLAHADRAAFTVGDDVANTPGKVIHETPLYQLIQYDPVTPTVRTVPILIFPPWINRFYILDLNPGKSFVRWAVANGLTVFMVSWRSVQPEMGEIGWDDYVGAQIDAMAAVRRALDVPTVHPIGYCVAGTTLAATLAILTARKAVEGVAGVTFLTTQIDFSEAGDLKFFTSDEHLALLAQISASGVLDGRYMAATFNALRSRDLIWNYVIGNYLLGEDKPAFDLLFWNGDSTNLPRHWHQSYLADLYRRNLLAEPGGMRMLGEPIDVGRVAVPAYLQAGRDDHIAPARSVWKTLRRLSGPKRFVLAGSGHIAGVVNPPALNKYGYWTNDAADTATLDDFVAGAVQHAGSWWPDWLAWVSTHLGEEVPAKAARIPGKGKLKPIEDAPGRYVTTR